MEIRRAKPEDFSPIMALYDNLIDSMRDSESKPTWEKGVYPAELFIRDSIEQGELLLAITGDFYAAAMVLNNGPSDVNITASISHN